MHKKSSQEPEFQCQKIWNQVLIICLIGCILLVDSFLRSLAPVSSFHKGSGLPLRLSSKESTCQYRRHRFSPWSGKIPYAMEQLSSCTTTIEPLL